MLPNNTHLLYFSATGTTKKITETFGRAFVADRACLPAGNAGGASSAGGSDTSLTDKDGVASFTGVASFAGAAPLPDCAPSSSGNALTIRDLLRRPLREELRFTGGDFVVIGTPVYSGRAAPIALQSLRWLRGENTPAVILVAYGNRAYDDALVELQDFLEERGFVVVGAGAFVARHAVFPRYAVGRPDAKDLDIARNFAARVREKLTNAARAKETPEAAARLAPGALFIKGSRPYRKPVDMTLYPRAGEACIGCGTCAAICPAGVINPQNPRQRPKKGCLSCAACIHACPQKARSFGGFTYTFFDVVFDFIFRVLFFWKKKVRTEPEIFV